MMGGGVVRVRLILFVVVPSGSNPMASDQTDHAAVHFLHGKNSGGLVGSVDLIKTKSVAKQRQQLARDIRQAKKAKYIYIWVTLKESCKGTTQLNSTQSLL